MSISGYFPYSLQIARSRQQQEPLKQRSEERRGGKEC